MRAILIATVVVLTLAGVARSDFYLFGNEILTVNAAHEEGRLYDQSQALVTDDGSVWSLETHDSSYVAVSGGTMFSLGANENSSIQFLSGSVSYLSTAGYSTAVFRGGAATGIAAVGNSSVRFLGGIAYSVTASGVGAIEIAGGQASIVSTSDAGIADISGGAVTEVRAYDNGRITFHGRQFLLGPGLSVDGDRVLGTGNLYGQWLDGTDWTVNISQNGTEATVLAPGIPEPASLSLLALAGPAVFRRRVRHAPAS